MTPEGMYNSLRRANAATPCDPFDGHVLACIFAAAADDVQRGGFFTDALGICGASLRKNVEHYFPGVLPQLEPLELDRELVVEESERCLRELLWRFRSRQTPLNSLLTLLLARRATRSNHLWQDLGLTNRGELSTLMARHFTQLSQRNNQDMKWKKFFYRMICREDGFRMCVAPSCSECNDFQVCFGDESGESLLVRTRLTDEMSGIVSIAPAMA
jgi:nitrogen fixation protein NifQ